MDFIFSYELKECDLFTFYCVFLFSSGKIAISVWNYFRKQKLQNASQ